MKKIYRKEEGVSPVIATILMVAITVVLAATVYIMVAGLGGTSSTPLSMNLSYDATGSNATKAVFDVSMTNPSQTSYSNVKVTIKNSTSGKTGTVTLGTDGTGTVTVGANGLKYDISISDLNGNGKLDTGDQIVITPNSANSDAVLGGLEIYVYITGYSGNSHAVVPS